MNEDIRNILEILSFSEKLKFELRHSWLSNGRQESVAEHTWRMSLFAILISPLLKKDLDLLKVLKMIVIHDLVEAEAGDVSLLEQYRNPEIKIVKAAREKQAINNIRVKLSNINGQELYDLFYEFESKTSYEAKVANAIDKLEAQLQHNHADISTWEKIEYEFTFLLDKHVEFDEVFTLTKNLIVDEAEDKLSKSGIDLLKVKENAEKLKKKG